MILFLITAIGADLVLSKHRHGNGNEHYDELRCFVAERTRHAAVPVERLIEDFVLPPILWCVDIDARNFSAPSNCFDRGGHGAYKLMQLECKHGCRASFDCAPFVSRFWSALMTTLGCMLLSVGIRLAFDKPTR
jgi:hypothetical protein